MPLSRNFTGIYSVGVMGETMSTYFVINIEEFKLKKNHPNTIFFKATCPVFAKGVFDLEYTGPDLYYKVSLPSDYMDKVCKEMQEVFGYGPFDRSKVKQAMKEHNQFQINQSV